MTRDVAVVLVLCAVAGGILGPALLYAATWVLAVWLAVGGLI